MVIKITHMDLIYDPKTHTYTTAYWLHLKYLFFLYYEPSRGMNPCWVHRSDDIKDKTTWNHMKKEPFSSSDSAIKFMNRFLKKNYGGYYLELE